MGEPNVITAECGNDREGTMCTSIRSTQRIALIALTLLGLALAPQACGSSDDGNSVNIGVDASDNNSNVGTGEVQRCENDETKSIDCPAGNCNQSCAGGGKCNFSCSGGKCKQLCAGGASCNFTCAGGGCVRNDSLGALCN